METPSETAPAVQGQTPPPTPPPEAPKTEDDVLKAALAAIEAAEKEGQGEVRETPPVEEKKEEPKAIEPKEEEVRHSQRLAELARRDQRLREQTRALKEREAHLAEIQKKAEAYDKREAELAESFKKDPFGTLQHFGVDILTALGSLGGDAAPDAKRTDPQLAELKSEIAALKQKLADDEKGKQEERAKASHAALYGKALDRINDVVAADPEAYEAILDRGSEGLANVYRALDAMYQELVDRGENPGPPSDGDIAAGAQIVERVLREQELEELRQKAGRKRYAGRLNLGEPPTKGTQATAPAASPSPPTTLTNSLQSEAPQRRPPLTDEERLAAAMAIPFPTGKPG